MTLLLVLACATNDHPVQESVPAQVGDLCTADRDCETNTCWQPADTGCTAVCSNGCFSDNDCEDLASALPNPDGVFCGDDGYCDLSASGADDLACQGS